MKILLEIFCPKLIVSNDISAFLDYLKPKNFLPANHGGWHRAPPHPPFKISVSAPVLYITIILNVECGTHGKWADNTDFKQGQIGIFRLCHHRKLQQSASNQFSWFLLKRMYLRMYPKLISKCFDDSINKRYFHLFFLI